MVDGQGRRTWRAELNSYGAVRTLEGTRTGCPFRYQGQYEDAETGLCYNRFRYYDPDAGQYLSQDPIGLAGGMAAYAYVPDPTTWVDALGLSGCKKLSDNMASTFLGGKYSARVLQEDMILYRTGEKGKPLGQFFSKDAPVSEIQARIDKAILPVWPGGATSVIDTGYMIKIPKGTTIYTGKIAPQGGVFLGGTQQIVVETPWLIDDVEVLKSFPLFK